jgi:hypothetical protein
MSQDSNTPVEAGQVGRTAHTSRARKAWVAPKVLTAQLRDTSSSVRRFSRSLGPGHLLQPVLVLVRRSRSRIVAGEPVDVADEQQRIDGRKRLAVGPAQ